MSCLLLVTVWGGAEYRWGSATIVGLGSAGLVLLARFWFRRVGPTSHRSRCGRSGTPSSRRPASPRSRSGPVMFGAIVFVALYLKVVNGVSPTASGLHLTPIMAGVIVGSVGSGRLITRFGRYKVFPVVGTAVMVAGLYLLSGLDPDTPRAVQALSNAIVGLGIGLVMQVLVLAVQNAWTSATSAPPPRPTRSSARWPGSFGVAIYGAIFANRLAHHLAEPPQRVSSPLGSRIDLERLRALPGPLRTCVHVGIDSVADEVAAPLLEGEPAVSPR